MKLAQWRFAILGGLATRKVHTRLDLAVQIRELSKTTASDLSKIEIQPGGDGISFRSIDVDIYQEAA